MIRPGADHSKATLAYMMENLPFSIGPPVPQMFSKLEPIENLWGILAQKIYEGGWEAKTQQELISRIES